MTLDTENMQFYPLVEDRIALVDNGVIYRNLDMFCTTGRIETLIFLDKEALDTYLRNRFIKLRESIVDAVFSPEAIEARKHNQLYIRNPLLKRK